MSIIVRFGRGKGILLSSNGDDACLSLDFSSPPGSSLQGIVENSPMQVTFKVRSCRLSAPGAYRVEGRWVNLGRATREHLRVQLSSAAGGDGT